MTTQARITLIPLNGDVPFPEQRTLTLDPNQHTIQIGRASKSPSKGLQAAVDNAWFDSPVMSRNHAEMSFDIKNSSIQLKDIGSMHGTFINDQQLPLEELTELHNGDTVVFGAEVKRNTDTFPACVFQVNFALLPFKPTNSYTFPESDGEDDEISEDDMDDNEEPSSEDGVSIESPPPKVSQANEAIDLTRDDSPLNCSVIEVDSASHVQIEKNMVNVLAGRPTDYNRHADPVSVARHNGLPPILVDHNDGDSHFSSDFDDQSEIEVEPNDGATSDSESLDEQQEPEDDGGSDNETDDEVEKTSREVPGLASMEIHSLLNAAIPESHIRALVDESDNEVDEVDEVDDDEASDFGLHDAGVKGIRSAFDHGLLEHEVKSYIVPDSFADDFDSGSEEGDEAPTEQFVAEEKLETSKSITLPSLDLEKLPETTSKYAHFYEGPQALAKLDVPRAVSKIVRQPSPSDAAMVKSANPSAITWSQLTSAAKVHHLQSQDSQSLTAQSLGDKIGKPEFIAAREDNKAKAQAFEPSQPSWQQNDKEEVMASSSAERLESRKRTSRIAQQLFRERKRRMEANVITPNSTEIILPDLPTARATKLCKVSDRELGLLLTEEAFSPLAPLLSHQPQASRQIRKPSPEYDMTSAAAFNQSRNIIAATNNKFTAINDSIDDQSVDHAPRNLKRKAEDISIEDWASAPAGEIPSDPVPAPSAPEQRPAKRLRKIIESVGYVALGGATLFGALVLSAPDFL